MAAEALRNLEAAAAVALRASSGTVLAGIHVKLAATTAALANALEGKEVDYHRMTALSCRIATSDIEGLASLRAQLESMLGLLGAAEDILGVRVGGEVGGLSGRRGSGPRMIGQELIVDLLRIAQGGANRNDSTLCSPGESVDESTESGSGNREQGGDVFIPPV